VQPFGQRDFQGHAHRGAGRGAGGFHQRRDFRARPADLSIGDRCIQRERDAEGQEAVNVQLHFTSLSGMIPSKLVENGSSNFTGGTS
jgi:hypothetical protein